jgi:hypothetical protein
MSKPTGFHVRHDLQPNFTFELLMLLNALPEGRTEEDLREAANSQGYTLRQRKDYGKLLRSLEELGVIERNHKSPALTEKGRVIAQLSVFQKPLLPELIHFLYYTSWDNDHRNRFSWSYRTVSDWLWNAAPCTINRDRLVNTVTQHAADTFPEISVSFSTQSVLGILYWINALYPPCVDQVGRIFSRRLYCPIEIFMLALHHVYHLKRVHTISVLLTPEFRQQVCQICLITPDVFYELLEQATTAFECVQLRRERGDRISIMDFSWETLRE